MILNSQVNWIVNMIGDQLLTVVDHFHFQAEFKETNLPRKTEIIDIKVSIRYCKHWITFLLLTLGYLNYEFLINDKRDSDCNYDGIPWEKVRFTVCLILLIEMPLNKL